MVKFILVGVLGFGLLFFVLKAHSEYDIEGFSQRMMTFYKIASPEAFQKLQQDAHRYEWALVSISSTANLLNAVSIARIAKKHTLPIEPKGVTGQLAQEILAGSSDLAIYIADDEMTNPLKLDIWWASFFGTGDTAYLEKILQYAGESIPDGDMEKAHVIAAATWSFKSMCNQDETVREFAKQKMLIETNPDKLAYLQTSVNFTTTAAQDLPKPQ